MRAPPKGYEHVNSLFGLKVVVEELEKFAKAGEEVREKSISHEGVTYLLRREGRLIIGGEVVAEKSFNVYRKLSD